MNYTTTQYPCRLVMLTNEYRPVAGGIATYCYELTHRLHHLGIPTAVVAAHTSPHDHTFDQQQPFPIYRTTESKATWLRHASRYRQLRMAQRYHHPQLLWASDWRCGLTVAPAARLAGIPYVVTAYGSELLLAQASPVSRSLAIAVFNHAHTIFSISDYTRTLLCDMGIPKQKIAVIPLGVDPNCTPNSSKISHIQDTYHLHGHKVLLTLARLTPRKGHDVVLRALPRVLTRIPHLKYLIVGRGSDESRLHTLVNELGLGENVIFVGYVTEEDKSAYYAAADVFVMLSRQEGHLVEGFGLTLLEAGACGKPVVAGRHGGVIDAVLDGQTGYLVAPLDIDEVADKLIYLLEHEAVAHSMGQTAQRWVQQEANWKQVTQKTWALLQKAIETNTN